MKGKCIIFSAPSGSGKSTIISSLMEQKDLNLVFSVSATSRKPRGQEQHGREYLFFSEEEFVSLINKKEFLEYEEVYQGTYYGTLKSQVEELMEKGFNVVFDVDVVGGCNIKEHYADRALSIFIQAPSVEELRARLLKRNTDTEEMIQKRVAKAAHEMTYSTRFDKVIINDDLERAIEEVRTAVKSFISCRGN